MATDVTPPLQTRTPATLGAPIAPALHTLGLVAAVLALSFTGSERVAANTARPHGRLILYVATIVVDWVIVGYIWMGVKRRGLGLRDVIGGKWKSAEDALLDLAIAVGFWVTWSFLVLIASFALGHAKLDPAHAFSRASELKKNLGFIVPQGLLEIAAFVALTFTAGFCEELIYRGYFQQQFRAWTNNLWLAIIAQGVLFGASHAYQGWRSMSVIAIFGSSFGILAAWRKNLRPGMMAHAWQDLFTGFVLKMIMKFAP
jgi:membrane protease YdiL (CAAX protease family)